MEALLSWLGFATSALQSAFLQGILSFFGVVVTGCIAIWTWSANKHSEKADRTAFRSEKRMDTRRALWAETDALWRQLFLNGSAESHIALAAVRFQQARANQEKYTPFVASVTGLSLVDALTFDIALLDAQEIACIVRLSRHLHAVDEMAKDMRTDAFSGLALERKEAMLVHYLRMLGRAELLAEMAITTLEASLEMPENEAFSARKTALETERNMPTLPAPSLAAISKKASGQIHPEQASAEADPAVRRALRKRRASKTP